MADISREDAAAIISAQKATDIVTPATPLSVVLSTWDAVPMSKKTLKTPFLSAIPTAGFVTESATDASGVKPTSEAKWTNREMTAEEIAVIVPVHENVIDDADIDIWETVTPLVAAEFGRVLDLAVLYGIGAPTSWADDANLVAKAVAAGNAVAQGSTSYNGIAQGSAGARGDLASDFNAVLGAVEADNFDATDVFAVKSLKSALRGLRDANGSPIYLDNVRSDGGASSLLGADLRYLHKDVVQTGAQSALAVALDRTQFQVGIREDFTVKFLTEATVNGINLAERDMVAMRFKFRVAFGSKVSPLAGAGAYPVGVLRKAA